MVSLFPREKVTVSMENRLTKRALIEISTYQKKQFIHSKCMCTYYIAQQWHNNPKYSRLLCWDIGRKWKRSTHSHVQIHIPIENIVLEAVRTVITNVPHSEAVRHTRSFFFSSLYLFIYLNGFSLLFFFYGYTILFELACYVYFLQQSNIKLVVC